MCGIGRRWGAGEDRRRGVWESRSPGVEESRTPGISGRKTRSLASATLGLLSYVVRLETSGAGGNLRMALLPESDMYALPALSTATAMQRFSAGVKAGPPSPQNLG